MKNSTARTATTKEQILKVACELFRIKGFDGTTMREIADKCGMATGAAYYHFRNKEDLVFAYYLELEVKSEADMKGILESSKSGTERLKQVVLVKFRQLRADRELVRALARVAADPKSSLSPLSPETADIRHRAVKMMDDLIAGSDLKAGKELAGQVGKILWLYYMVMIFFWAHDRSAEQKRSKILVDLTAPLLIKLLSLSSLPMTGKLNRAVAQAVITALEAADEPEVIT